MSLILTNKTSHHANPAPGVAPITFSHNHINGTDEALVIVVASPVNNPISCTYGGVSLNVVQSYSGSFTSPQFYWNVYQLLGDTTIPTGTNNVVISYGPSGQYDSVSVMVYSFTGSSGVGNTVRNNTSTKDCSAFINISNNSRVICNSICGNSPDAAIEVPIGTVIASESGSPQSLDYLNENPGNSTWGHISGSLSAGTTSGKATTTISGAYGVVMLVEVKESEAVVVPPTVITTVTSSITSSTASSGGNVTSGGGATVTERGVCWSTFINPTTALSTKTINGSGTGSFTSSITGLSPATLYYVRAYATNSAGTSYGQNETFTTLAASPSITTVAISSITSTTASSGGASITDGGSSITAKGVCWSTSSNPTTADSKTTNGTGTSNFTSSITGLSPGTTYYVRAYATNSIGTSYGNQLTFTTSIVIPTLTTVAISNLTSSSANSGGQNINAGGGTVTAKGVCWSTSSNPTIANSKTTDGTGTSNFTSLIENLTYNTTYYVRAYATNSAGTGYGNELSFSTLAIEPIIDTLTATSLTQTSAILNANIVENGGSSITDYGFYWGLTSNPTTQLQVGTTDYTGAFDVLLDSLSQGTTYYFKAYATNSIGTSYGDVLNFKTIANTSPIIEIFTNNGPILYGTSAQITWVITSGTGTSAFIDNGIGWIEPYQTSGTLITSEIYEDTLFTIVVYDSDLDTSTASTTVISQNIPTGVIEAIGVPVCSGTNFTLQWSTSNATSAYIDNGIGQVSLNGSYTLSAGISTAYTLSAVNGIGVFTDSVNAIMYYRDPIAYAGEDVVVNSVDGLPVSVGLDANGSYDPDGLPLTYEWSDGNTIISTSNFFIRNYPVGTTTVTLSAIDNCGKIATDEVNVTVNYNTPPIAIATVNKPFIAIPGESIILDGSGSYDPDGSIVSYAWYYNGQLKSTNPIYSGFITTNYGVYTFTLVVTDNNGLTAQDTVIVTLSQTVNPVAVANAGNDIVTCFIDPLLITLNGSNSQNGIDGTIVWFEYNLSAYNVPSVSANITSLNQISATFYADEPGTNDIILTVSASNGYTDIDSVRVTINDSPRLSATDVYGNIQCGSKISNINLSAYSDNTISPQYFWVYDNNIVATGQFPTVQLSKGDYEFDVYVVDSSTNCVSDTVPVNIYVSGGDLSIDVFTMTPSTGIIYDVSATTIDLSWNVVGATHVYIDTLGEVSASGTESVEIFEPFGAISYTLTATDDECTYTQSVNGFFISQNTPIDACFTRENYIKTYGLDELKFGTDRYINLVNYLPEYVRNTETEVILQIFEDYLNNMYDGQKNYIWGERELELTVSNNNITKQWTSCNDIYACTSACDGDCTNYASSAVENTYRYD